MRAHRQDLSELLQECLDRIEAGETAKQCLDSYPEARAELEPLLRQAMRVRVAYAHQPDEAFMARAHEKLMFAAGRDVQTAWDKTPDPRFVEAARRRFLTAAGADAQEALRNVPPPRLAFWMNARQHMLEAAKSQPAPRRAPAGPVMALRFGMSAAIVVLALSLAGIGYMLTQIGGPSTNAEFALLDSDQRAVEQQLREGIAVEADVLNALTRRALELAAENPGAASLLDRQEEIIEQAAQVDPSLQSLPEIEIARQQLTDAQDRLAAAAATSSPEATADASVTVLAETATPSASPTATPTPQPLGENQIRVSALTSDTPSGELWFLLESKHLKVAIPAGANWTLLNTTTGTQTLSDDWVQLGGPFGTLVYINVRDGQIHAIVDGQSLLLRDVNGDTMPLLELVNQASPVATVLNNIIVTVEMKPTGSNSNSGSNSGSNTGSSGNRD